MADGVQIPVVVDIEGAFNEAARRVDTAIKPLQQKIEGDVLNVKFKMTVPIDDLEKFGGQFKEITRDAEAGIALIERSFEQLFAKGRPNIEELKGAIGSFKQQLNSLWNNGKMDDPMVKSLQQAIILGEEYLYQRNRAVSLTEEQYRKTLAAKRAEEERNFIIASEAKTMAEMTERISALRGKLQNVTPGSAEWRNTAREIMKATASLEKFEQKYTKITTKPGSINRITAEMQMLEQKWNEMSRAQKFDKNGNLKASAQRVIDKYMELTRTAEKFGMSLQQYAKQAGASMDNTKRHVDSTTDSLRRQSGVWSQLKSLAGMYVSVFGGLRLIRNIRETTAELELQRVALGGILQDTDRASDLFREIKAAALKSPFEIKDLVTYTKQLSAYRIETDKLFDVTMRLADVSAGLGVDMSRLILAYGQVRAAAVLRGQELRQFTEAGIPLVELLADKFQKLGREGTTVADVFDLISKRAVPFSMIEEIFNDMTDAGGMFYKMQEKQSETLKGQWMKLRDAVTIMYDEIGNTQGVHNAMEDFIKQALALTRSWKEVARWIATVGGAFTAYAVVARSTAIASKALAFQEALLIAKEKEQLIVLPKLIQKIVGDAAAKKISTRATMRLTAAQAKLKASTTILERAYWKLRVAMLSNPYALIAAGVAALGLAIVTLVKNSKQAEVSLESLEGAMASLREQSTKTRDVLSMIDTYEELTKKANKTTEEQKKLERVTRELSKAFPSAISGIDKESNSLQINIDKVRELTLAEQQLAEQRLRATAKEAESQLPELEAERDALLEKALKGRKADIWGGREALSSKALEKVEKRIQEITQLIQKYSEAIEEVNSLDFVGPMPQKTDETEQALSEWKKTIAKIQAEKVKAGAVQIFSPDDIQKFESVLKFSKELKKKYDEVNQSLKTNKELLKSATDATRADIESNINADEETLKMIEAIKTALGILFKTTAPRDTRLSQLKSDISELTNAYKKFKELTKYKGEESALSDINKLFPQLEGWTPTKDNLVKRLNEMLDKVKSDLARSPKSKTLLDMKRALETEISNLEFDDLKDKIETKLKNLQDEIKRSETARNFFNNILDLTGDEKLATTMSIEVYGGLGNNFKERLQHQLDTILESLDASKITDELRDAFAKQNFSVIMANLDKIPEAWHKELKDMADSTQKFSADQIQAWLKELQKVKTYAEQRVEIERKAQQRISEIRASDIDQATKSDLIAQYQRKQAEDVAKAQYEAFKNSPLYVQMFDSLDNASERVLRLMRERIAEMMASWKDLDPVQLKEMQSRLNEIDKQLATRNPFKVLSDSIKRYNDLMKSGRSRLGDETAAVEADAELKKQKELLETELKKLTAKRANLDATRKNKSANQGAVLAAEYEVKIQENVVEEQQENVNLAEKAANETARQAEEWKDIADLIGASSKTLQEYYGLFEQLEETIEQAFSIFLTDELADKARRTKDIINTLAGAIQNIAKAAASASAGDVAGAASSGFLGFLDIVSVGMQIADMIGQIKLDEWNKQIETQDRLIQALERSYSRLENVMNKSFGADYIYNYTEAVKALEATQEAYNKQLETSKEKEKEASKQEDREAAAQQSAQIEQNIQDTSEKLRKLEEQMQEFYVGSSLSEAAQEFANAWFEAYREFGSTSEAIKERMQDMINNLIVKASLAKVAEQILKPFYEELSKSAEAGTMTEDISMLIDMLNGKVGELNTGLNAMGQVLQSAGISLRGTVGSFRGISRDIAGASEEAILGLSAGINTQNFYMSAIHEDVSRIAAMLLGETESTNNAVPPTSASTGAEMKTVQELANIHLPHMDSTLSSIYELLTRVIKANGTTATHYVSVRM